MINAHLPGDLILLEPENKISINTAYQSMIRFRRSRFCHIAIVLDPSSIIHAMPKNGVSTEKFTEFLSQLKNRSFQVIRNIRLDECESLRFKLRERLLFYRKQKYNFVFSMRKGETSSYCSELAAKAFKDIGIPLSPKPTKSTMPIDLQPLLLNKEWRNVTSIYSVLETDFPSFFQQLRAPIEESAELNVKVEDLIQKTVRNQQHAVDLMNELNRIMGLEEIKLDFPREYWDSKLK